jgi:hypothetical protein
LNIANGSRRGGNACVTCSIVCRPCYPAKLSTSRKVHPRLVFFLSAFIRVHPRPIKPLSSTTYKASPKNSPLSKSRSQLFSSFFDPQLLFHQSAPSLPVRRLKSRLLQKDSPFATRLPNSLKKPQQASLASLRQIPENSRRRPPPIEIRPVSFTPPPRERQTPAAWRL